MKLARANLTLVHIDAVGRTGQRRDRSVAGIRLPSNSAHPRRISRPCGELVARWHVSPETGRVECRWMPELPPADEYLCAGYTRARRRLRPMSRRLQPIRPVTNLSRIR